MKNFLITSWKYKYFLRYLLIVSLALFLSMAKVKRAVSDKDVSANSIPSAALDADQGLMSGYKIYLAGSLWEPTLAESVIILFVLLISFALYRYRIRFILSQKETLEKMVKKRTKELKQKNMDLILAKKEMDDILENVKEGLFLINKDYCIESQYSAALEGILSKTNLGKTNFIDYFSNKLNEEEVSSIKEYLDILFDETIDVTIVNDLNPLSNTKLEFSYTKEDTITKYLTFEFGRIFQDGHITKIIASVNDITEKLILEHNLEISKREVEQRANRLQIILNIEPAMLKEFIVSTKDELNTLNRVIRNKSMPEKERLNQVYESIHVIKGNASLLGFTFFADHAHEIEDFICEIHKDRSYTKASMYNIKCLVVGLNDLYHELKTLIERLSKFLEQFRNEKDEENKVLVKSMQKLVSNISHEQGVDIRLTTDNFENYLIPRNYRSIVKDVLVQLIRNSAYHGIEKEAERLKNKKNKKAVIDLSTYETENSIFIKLHDDGRGIQIEKVREKARSLGLWSTSVINNWTDEEVYNTIFVPGISTADSVSITAGRGIGMDIIKNKLNSIGGSITLKSQEGRFCEFIIEVPQIISVDEKETTLEMENI